MLWCLQVRLIQSEKGRTHSFTDDRMWVDIYEPLTEADLAVHVRKVDDVRRWFNEAFEGGPSGKLKKYRVRLFYIRFFSLH